MHNTQISGSKLRIPVYTASASESGKRKISYSEPKAGAVEGETCGYQVVENAPMSKMFPDELLSSLLVVKLEDEEPTSSMLKGIKNKGDVRRYIFSSGRTHYFGSPELKQEVGKYFRSEPDGVVRYGSLLTSNCYKGLQSIGADKPIGDSDGTIKLKIVDYSRDSDKQYETDDCHGKCSSALARKMGSSPTRPFQFRLMWDENKADPDRDQIFLPSFISKGTFAADDDLVQDDNQIILDRSSIKGINKKVLDKFIPCGDYVLDGAVIGNREEAKNIDYKNSWQFTSCFSAKAVAADLAPATEARAKFFADLQSDPARLKRYIVSQFEKRDEDAPTGEVDGEIDDGEKDEQNEDPNMIKLLKEDNLGILNSTPKVQNYMRDRLQRTWKELAINGAMKHGSARALPSRELKPGQISVPGIADGEVMIVTRSPIPSKDNIRKYTNTDKIPKLQRYRGVIWMNPDDAAKHHQADFDGDQMQMSPARALPNIAKEVKWAGEPGDFKPMGQRPKKPYVSTDLSIYTDDRESLKQSVPITGGSVQYGAIMGTQNKVGIVANLIGKIGCADPTDEERRTHVGMEEFHETRKDLLGRLMAGLLVEVDHNKSAERIEDVEEIGGETLLKEAKSWTDSHDVPFFKKMKDEDTYRHFLMPDTGSENSPVEVLCRVANQHWESIPDCRVDRKYFRQVIHSDEEIAAAKAHPRYPEIKEIASEYKDQFAQLNAENSKPEVSKEEARRRIGRFYEKTEDYVNQGLGMKDVSKEEIPEIRQLFQLAVWDACHTQESGIDSAAYKKGQPMDIWASNIDPTFGPKKLQISKQPQKDTVYVLSSPFGSKTDQIKDWLDTNGVSYTAYQQRKVPMMDFVLDKGTPEATIKKLGNYYSQHSGRPVRFRGQAVRPKKYDQWSIRRDAPSSGALAYNVCMPELLSAVRRQQHMREGIRVQGLQYNGLAKQGNMAIKGAYFRVGQYKGHEHINLNGKPCLESSGGVIGSFPENQKVPMIGTIFKSDQFRLIEDSKKGIVTKGEGDVKEDSIYVPGSSHETDGADLKSKEAAIKEGIASVNTERNQLNGQSVRGSKDERDLPPRNPTTIKQASRRSKKERNLEQAQP